MDKWEIYQDSIGYWRWRRVAPNGLVVGRSTEGYETQSDCVAELERNTISDARLYQFVECRGALFKRKALGGYQQTVFCPVCQRPMMSFQRTLPYSCKCGISLDFTASELQSVMSELPL
jgi:uncharacterized protein YegP (UPF0339 family)